MKKNNGTDKHICLCEVNKDSAEDLMQERIERFNQYAMSQDINKIPIGLFCGKMGLCIYFYHQAEDSNNKVFKRFADKLLTSIFNQINTKSLISLEDGLIGICLGANYLIDKGFQNGNINHIVSELDDKIYQIACFELMENTFGSSDTIKSVFEVAFYFSIRLQNAKLDENNRFLFESIVIKSINYMERTYNYSEQFIEPSTYSLNTYFFANYLYLLTLVYKLNFYNYKIFKILDEIRPKLLNTYPLLQANKLQLLAVLEKLSIELRHESIDLYIKKLRREIDCNLMIISEFRNKSLLLANGLCGMYLVQNILFNNTELPEPLIMDRITKSELWDDIYKDEAKLNATIGLFTGLAGIILVYQKMIKKDSK